MARRQAVEVTPEMNFVRNRRGNVVPASYSMRPSHARQARETAEKRLELERSGEAERLRLSQQAGVLAQTLSRLADEFTRHRREHTAGIKESLQALQGLAAEAVPEDSAEALKAYIAGVEPVIEAAEAELKRVEAVAAECRRLEREKYRNRLVQERIRLIETLRSGGPIDLMMMVAADHLLAESMITREEHSRFSLAERLQYERPRALENEARQRRIDPVPTDPRFRAEHYKVALIREIEAEADRELEAFRFVRRGKFVEGRAGCRRKKANRDGCDPDQRRLWRREERKLRA